VCNFLPSVDSNIFNFVEVPSQALVYQMLVAELDEKQLQASYMSDNSAVDKNTAACLDEVLNIMSNQ